MYEPGVRRRAVERDKHRQLCVLRLCIAEKRRVQIGRGADGRRGRLQLCAGGRDILHL